MKDLTEKRTINLAHSCGREMERLGFYRKPVTYDKKGNRLSGPLLLEWFLCANCPNATGKARSRMVGI